jgi:hypothetical protein
MSLDLSIPEGLPDDVVAKLRDLQQELDVSPYIIAGSICANG